jgi:enoyl-CoA hydratase
MTEAVLLLEKAQGYAVLTLNRPQAMNALSRVLREDLAATVDDLSEDRETRVLVLTGAGRAFCAGLDLKEIGSEPAGGAALPSGETANPCVSLRRFPGPVIGAINGPAVTGGFELALACDVLLASTNARFADTHARVGLLPGWGLSQRLSRTIGIRRAKELSLTGNLLDAETAAAWGLVNRVVKPDELLPTARRLAEDMLSVVPEMLPAYKRLIDEGFASTLADGLRLETARSRAWNASVPASAIAKRRGEITARGRIETRSAKKNE